MLNRKTISVAVIVLVVLSGLYFLVWRPSSAADDMVYVTEALDRGSINRSIYTSGTVQPVVSVDVGSQLSGQITALYKDYNSEVRKDEIIAKIDPRSFAARVRQSEADVALADANLEKAKASLVQEQALLHQAELAFRRQKELLGRGNVSQSAYDEAEASYKTAEAAVLVARSQVKNAEAALLQSRENLEQNQLDLDRTDIRSPIDGVVIDRVVNVGQTVAASMSTPVLFTIAQDLREMQIEAEVDEADIGNIRDGNIVFFTVDAFPDLKFEGSVRQVRLAPEESQSVVTYTVIISARNEELKLLPGMTANVNIITGQRKNVLRVRNQALRYSPRDESLVVEAEPLSAPPANGSRSGPRLPEELNLTDAQQAEIDARLKELFDSNRDRIMGPPPGAAERDAMRQRMNNIFREVLTPEQFDLLEKEQNSRERPRDGVLYTRDADGRLVRYSILIGISDEDYTEIIGNPPYLSAGTEVVLREKSVRKD
ncbi:efflux RND transporter periplasmic adaptor subunit [Emcibacter nanhaiensis]|uniref:Efflux RND transporter periplasmic adaptor subunit n=1 Tax=Emcibacter nanhaiensis TaxID=1505037 RepID=A0A501PRD1_9PROT|nr:efflux RND transporter periplasmic adaptor subunit [Emcibacter nanhaiensis]